MQLTIKLLSLLRQKQDTYTYEYFHEPPVIPQKLKEVGQSLLWNVRTCLWNVYLTNKQNKNKIERHPQSHTLIFSYLSEVSWCSRCTCFFSGTEGSQAWKEMPLNILIVGMRTADPLTMTFYRSKEDSQVPCFCPSSLTFVVARYDLWLWKKRGRPLCLTLYKTFCHSLNNLLLPKTGLQVR